jgi:4-oxalocrotonate tautomerase family enzyme
MPLIQVKLIENVFTPEQKSHIITKLTDAMVSIEGENMHQVTSAVIEEVRSGEWGIGGQVTLNDGSEVSIRPIQPGAERVLIQAFKRLSPESVYQRFFSPLRELPAYLVRHLANVDYVKRLALIAESPVDGKADPVGIARYDATQDPGVVELALVVVDEWQRRGLGRILLRSIMSAAAGNGFHCFRGNVLWENHAMLQLLDTECNIHARKAEGGVITLTFTPRTEAV